VTTCLLATMIVATSAVYLSHNKPKPIVEHAYADPTSCVQCHATEAAGYASSGMAHAFSSPQGKTTVESSAPARQFFHEASSTYYSMTEHGGKYFQRRWQEGFSGKPENIEELQIDYIMGSGNHVRTYLHREKDGSLIELPLAWYSELGRHWGMNPGYDNPHPMTIETVKWRSANNVILKPPVDEDPSPSIARSYFQTSWDLRTAQQTHRRIQHPLR
jgi:hypothetical protein